MKINNTHRELHGALLDSEILADVYLAMTGGQTRLILGDEGGDGEISGATIIRLGSERSALNISLASDEELTEHRARIAAIAKKCDAGAVWETVFPGES